MTLDLVEFDAYFEALHGYLPFPWQRRLFEHIAEHDRWPESIAIPTGLGKTACIDIAVFSLAHLWSKGNLTLPRRIFYVVDRRIIVDEAFERAKKLATMLENAHDGILKETAERLRALAGAEAIETSMAPIACFELRGGIYRDDGWARNPAQVTIICTTVDQYGSRLLFRSYGNSPRVWPIHAGLAANDSLVLLDEAHCAQPFLETLDKIRLYREWAEQPLQNRFDVVSLTATPRQEISEEEVFKLTLEDKNHPVIQKRIANRKLIELSDGKTVSPKDRTKAFGEFALQLVARCEADQGRHPAVAVFVNQVQTAFDVYKWLEKKRDEGKEKGRRKSILIDYELVLLTGRMRPFDREVFVQPWLDRLRSDRSEKRKLARAIIVVTTQCLEIGADLDFDALVSENASIDALIQRFGRLNRLGHWPTAFGAILKTNQKDEDSVFLDPVYGVAAENTWLWLWANADNGIIDFSVQAIQEKIWSTPPKDVENLRMPTAHAAVLLPAHMDHLVQTNPCPHPEMEISYFLHGIGKRTTDVQVCWRLDLGNEDIGKWMDILSLCPPAVAEFMSVPLHRFRKWLTRQKLVGSDCDIEGVGGEDNKDSRMMPRRQKMLPVLRWMGPEESEFIQNPDRIRPGDVLVVPGLEGWSELGYIPEDALLVSQTERDKESRPVGECLHALVDVGDFAHKKARGSSVLRLHPAMIGLWPECPEREALFTAWTEEALPDADLVAELLQGIMQTIEMNMQFKESVGFRHLADSIKGLLKWKFQVFRHPDKGIVIVSKRKDSVRASRETFSSNDDMASATVPVSLTEHSVGVARKARKAAETCQLGEEIVQTLEMAGYWHDAGKADLRFQSLLCGGNRLALVGAVLAKSDHVPKTFRERRNAFLRSGLPGGFRHEVLSCQLIEHVEKQPEHNSDPELVKHLVCTHHGFCRPMAPFVHDELHPAIKFEIEQLKASLSSEERGEWIHAHRLDSGLPERFWRMIQRYGWWGIAYLEAIFRLADHRESEEEEKIRTGRGEGGRGVE
ncbi:type I-U CRISPR-associated helicase/endonuclease Cas3 [Heliobacterium gestii]|uniref:Type I-U CRISPR-associated helicase/endonuclease Cas3 n=1 Tax=Heliomicrobium gestii TaxID=2699 RepID=A0A845L9T2_HELGE|nr:type I-U CRISPR-associated helicase/endonuclease Cas3 [Heliomicrobium gestii]MBM7867088.1 CRISPR-associated endonuclease/helicase Cas3 [Heliomicrobium gestii]MZP43497.1 type I-U CRISPR-associated helicase/endonuclease Cas3 [Heliomicrobium gestii]